MAGPPVVLPCTGGNRFRNVHFPWSSALTASLPFSPISVHSLNSRPACLLPHECPASPAQVIFIPREPRVWVELAEFSVPHPGGRGVLGVCQTRVEGRARCGWDGAPQASLPPLGQG